MGIVIRPILTFSIAEYKAYGGKMKFGKARRQDTYGVCQRSGHLILVRVRDFKENRHIADLTGTLIHELVHLKFWRLHHGAKFNKIIEQVKKGKKFD